MTFANGEAFTENPIENWGVFFIGNRASLQVNRQGYAVRPVVPPVRNKVGPPPPPTAGGVTLGAGGTAIAPGGPGGPGGGRGGGRGSNLPPVEAKVYVNPRGGVEEDYPLDVHTREFPRLHQVAAEAERPHGDRLSLGAPMSARTGIDRAGQANGLGRGSAEE